RPHSRRVEERAAGAAGTIDDRLGERENLLAVVSALVPRVVDQAAPAMTNADDLVAVAEGANRDGADGGIETGDIAAAGEDADSAFGHGAENRANGRRRKGSKRRRRTAALAYSCGRAGGRYRGQLDEEARSLAHVTFGIQ